MPVDYSKGKIYKIVDNTNGNIYIGSTSEPTLARRLSGHVRHYKQWLNGKYHFVTSFKVLENDDYEIILLESYPCKSKDELHARERFWTNQIDCVNKLKNQGMLIELGENKYYKQYRQNNKESVKEYQKQYRENNKDSITKYKNHYYETNKDSIKEYGKQYYKTNKKEIKNKMNQKIACECGRCYTLNNKARHMKSDKHQYYEQNKVYFIIKKGLDLIKAIENLL